MGIGQCKERFGLFRENSSMFIIDIYGYIGTKSLKNAFDNGFCKKR